jgi:hypothetical protein
MGVSKVDENKFRRTHQFDRSSEIANGTCIKALCATMALPWGDVAILGSSIESVSFTYERLTGHQPDVEGLQKVAIFSQDNLVNVLPSTNTED